MMSKERTEVGVVFYMPDKEFQRAIRQYLYKQGHGHRITKLELEDSVELVDGCWRVNFWNPEKTRQEEWAEEEEC